MNNRFIARAFLPFFLVFALCLPARQAHAQVGQAVALLGASMFASWVGINTLSGGTATAAVAGVPLDGLIASVSLHTMVAGLILSDKQDLNDPTAQKIRIQLDKNNPPPPPNAPITKTPTLATQWTTGAGTFSSVQAAAAPTVQYMCASNPSCASASVLSVNGTTITWNLVCQPGTCGGGLTSTSLGAGASFYTCDTGYYYNSAVGICQLVDARQAQKDNNRDILKTPTGFSEPADADTAGQPQRGKLTSTMFETGLVVSDGTSGGIPSPASLIVESLPDGSTSITMATQSQNAVGDSIIIKKTVTYSDSGAYKGSSQSTSSGSITVDPTTGVASGASSGSSSGSSSGNPVGATSGDISGLGNKLDHISNRLAQISDSAGQPTTVDGKSFSDQIAAAKKQLDDLLDKSKDGSALPKDPSFLWPDFTQQPCSPLQWTFQNHVVEFNLCTWVPLINSFQAWVLSLIAAMSCFSQVMAFRVARMRG